MSRHSNFTKRPLAAAVTFSSLLLACGNSPGDGNGAGGSADGGESPCGYVERFLPFQAGYSWTYRVTSLATPEVATKNQSLSMETDAELGEVLVQTTEKDDGRTVSFFQREGDVVLRLRQDELDANGVLQRSTAYNPGKIRLDESSERIVLGAEFDDTYEVVESDGTGFELSRGVTTDHWSVLAVDADCTSPLGDFKCLQIRRQRTAGGLSDKQYFFAKGVGKVKEVNASQVEEVLSCQ